MRGLEARIARLEARVGKAAARGDRPLTLGLVRPNLPVRPASRRLPRPSPRPESQRPPAGDWRVWAYVAGRGAGKTRAGACWIQRRVEAGTMKLGCLIAPTAADIRDVMVEGPSGLLAVAPPGAGLDSSRRNAASPGPTAPRGLPQRRGARARPRA